MTTAPLIPGAYEPHLNERFTVFSADGSSAQLVLDAVRRKLDDEIQLCFVVQFSGTKPILPQGTYRVTHPVLGEFELFIVPMQPRRDRCFYEAGFNLLKEGSA